MAPGIILNDGNVTVLNSPTAESALDDDWTSQVNGSSVLHRSLHRQPLQVAHAIGNYITLANGQNIIDATGGAAVSCLGHGNERVNAAVAQQMIKFSYAHILFLSSGSSEELAKLLTESTDGHMTKAFIVSSGSEAMESTMKLARQYSLEFEQPEHQRINFIARKESYHGITLGARSMSGHIARRKHLSRR